MPIHLTPSVTRREFLKTSTLGAAAAIELISTLTLRSQSPDSLRLALLSDTHIPADPDNEFRGFKPYANTQKIVPQVQEYNPQGVIINGDAARLTGEIADYEALKHLLHPLYQTTPIYVAMGNHDHRDHFLQTLSTQAGERPSVENKLITILEHPSVRIILLDSLLYVDKVAGLLGLAQRQWLTQYLAECDGRPTVFFLHHTLGERDSDCLDTEKLFQILAPHPKVKAIFYGHSHVHEYKKQQGIHLINLPAVGYNFADTQPVGWVQAQFHPTGVHLTLQTIGGNQNDHGKTTSLCWA